MSIDHVYRFVFELMFEALAVTAGVAWCFGVFVVLMRFIDRALNKSDRKEV